MFLHDLLDGVIHAIAPHPHDKPGTCFECCGRPSFVAEREEGKILVCEDCAEQLKVANA